MVSDITETPAVTPTATVPAAAPVMDSDNTLSSAIDCTTTDPSASADEPAPM